MVISDLRHERISSLKKSRVQIWEWVAKVKRRVIRLWRSRKREAGELDRSLN